MDESSPARHCWDPGSMGFLVTGTFVLPLVLLGNIEVWGFEDCLESGSAVFDHHWDCNLGQADPCFCSSCLVLAEMLLRPPCHELRDWWPAFFPP